MNELYRVSMSVLFNVSVIHQEIKSSIDQTVNCHENLNEVEEGLIRLIVLLSVELNAHSGNL